MDRRSQITLQPGNYCYLWTVIKKMYLWDSWNSRMKQKIQKQCRFHSPVAFLYGLIPKWHFL